MTIRTEEPDVPSEFPPARLYLDDIEEIVRILREFVQGQETGPHSTVQDLRITVTFSAGGKECDHIQELPKIAKSNRQFDISISRGDWTKNSLRFHPWYGTTWRSLGFTKLDTLSAFHKLYAVFEKRKRHWSALVRTLPEWLVWLVWLASAASPSVLTPLLYKLMPHRDAIAIVALWLGTIVTVALIGARHTTIVFRNSWEHSALRQELLHKLPVIVITSALTFLLTLLGFYLKHKYWP